MKAAFEIMIHSEAALLMSLWAVFTVSHEQLIGQILTGGIYQQKITKL